MILLVVVAIEVDSMGIQQYIQKLSGLDIAVFASRLAMDALVPTMLWYYLLKAEGMPRSASH